MKIISCNVNGIRSALKKGLVGFVENEQPDILCLQEVKCASSDIPEELRNLSSYSLFLNCANKKGYSGVAVYTKQKPIKVDSILGIDRFDGEGRFLELEYPEFTILNLYFPHGGRQKENLEYKLNVYEKIFERTQQLKNKNVILIGDFNIAHSEIDLARPKQNKNNIMFSQVERDQIIKLIDMGFIDSFRKFNKETENYTWWPYAFDARNRNMGWRIDYCFVSGGMTEKISNASIYPDMCFSDHCPIGVEIK